MGGGKKEEGASPVGYRRLREGMRFFFEEREESKYQYHFYKIVMIPAQLERSQRIWLISKVAWELHQCAWFEDWKGSEQRAGLLRP